MLAKERQNQIFEIIKRSGAVETAKLAELFGVSIETIRKDLILLENQNALLKIHGGAVSKAQMSPRQMLSARCEVNGPQKMKLAKKAMKFISEGDVIGIDEGSTAIVFAKLLCENFSRLTVVTYSLDVLNILSECEGFELILCGGSYMKSERIFCGREALKTLKNIRVNKAFLFPTAISIEYGICGYNDSILQIQEQLIKSAGSVYVLADSEKFEKNALKKLCDNDQEFVYITDDELKPEILKAYKENNIKILTGGEN